MQINSPPGKEHFLISLFCRGSIVIPQCNFIFNGYLLHFSSVSNIPLIYIWNRNSNNPVNLKHDRMNTSLAKDSLQTDQANPVLSVLFFKYHSVTFSGTLEKMGPKIWARRPERAPPKVQRHRSLLTAPLFKPYLHKGLLRAYLFHKTNMPGN